MADHPVLPDMTPAKALRTLFVIGLEIARILACLLAVVAFVAFVLDRSFLGMLAVVGVVLCGGVLVRLHVAIKQLENDWF